MEKIQTVFALILLAVSTTVEATPTTKIKTLKMREPSRELVYNIAEVREMESDPSGKSLRVRPLGEAKWKGGVLFDDAIRDALRLKTKSARKRGARTSDLLLGFLISYPVAIDAIGVTGLREKNGEGAIRFLFVDAGAYSITGGVTYVIKKTVGRERPYGRNCDLNQNYSADCLSRNRNQSFISGHASFAFTAAGLVCAQHGEFNIYGGKADAAACTAAMGMAGTTGLLRILADKHYATDVLAGAAVGFLSGYVLPSLLYRTETFGDDEELLEPTQRLREATIFSFGGEF